MVTDGIEIYSIRGWTTEKGMTAVYDGQELVVVDNWDEQGDKTLFTIPDPDFDDFGFQELWEEIDERLSILFREE